MKTIILLLLFNISYCQSSIVASGSSNIIIGDNFGIMRSDMNEKEVSLSVPKFETPIEAHKPIVKKKLTFWQKLLKAIFG